MPVVSALLVELLTRDLPFGLGLDRDTALAILGYSYVQRRLTWRGRLGGFVPGPPPTWGFGPGPRRG